MYFICVCGHLNAMAFVLRSEKQPMWVNSLPTMGSNSGCQPWQQVPSLLSHITGSQIEGLKVLSMVTVRGSIFMEKKMTEN